MVSKIVERCDFDLVSLVTKLESTPIYFQLAVKTTQLWLSTRQTALLWTLQPFTISSMENWKAQPRLGTLLAPPLWRKTPHFL